MELQEQVIEDVLAGKAMVSKSAESNSTVQSTHVRGMSSTVRHRRRFS